MAFPPYGTTVPTLNKFNFSFNGLTFGPATTNENSGFGFTKIEGLDRPDVRDGDVDAPRSRGQFVGLDLLAARDITITGELGTDGTSLFHASQQLRNIFSPRGTTQDPLFFCDGTGTTYAIMVRIRKDNIPIDFAYSVGALAQIVVQFHALDPNFYSTPTQLVTCGLPDPTGGFTFDIVFPWNFNPGSPGPSNFLNLTNAGNVNSYPIFTINGPCINPIIININTGQYLQFNLTLGSTDVLVVDTDNPHSAQLNGIASRLSYLSPYSQWFSLVPELGPNASNGGVTTIEFNSGDLTQAAGTLAIQYASAYSSLT